MFGEARGGIDKPREVCQFFGVLRMRDREIDKVRDDVGNAFLMRRGIVDRFAQFGVFVDIFFVLQPLNRAVEGVNDLVEQPFLPKAQSLVLLLLDQVFLGHLQSLQSAAQHPVSVPQQELQSQDVAHKATKENG